MGRDDKRGPEEGKLSTFKPADWVPDNIKTIVHILKTRTVNNCKQELQPVCKQRLKKTCSDAGLDGTMYFNKRGTPSAVLYAFLPEELGLSDKLWLYLNTDRGKPRVENDLQRIRTNGRSDGRPDGTWATASHKKTQHPDVKPLIFTPDKSLPDDIKQVIEVLKQQPVPMKKNRLREACNAAGLVGSHYFTSVGNFGQTIRCYGQEELGLPDQLWASLTKTFPLNDRGKREARRVRYVEARIDLENRTGPEAAKSPPTPQQQTSTSLSPEAIIQNRTDGEAALPSPSPLQSTTARVSPKPNVHKTGLGKAGAHLSITQQRAPTALRLKSICKKTRGDKSAARSSMPRQNPPIIVSARRILQPVSRKRADKGVVPTPKARQTSSTVVHRQSILEKRKLDQIATPLAIAQTYPSPFIFFQPILDSSTQWTLEGIYAWTMRVAQEFDLTQIAYHTPDLFTGWTTGAAAETIVDESVVESMFPVGFDPFKHSIEVPCKLLEDIMRNERMRRSELVNIEQLNFG